MFNKKIEDDSEHSFWISYADMLTGFLISFMVIALLLASKAKDCPVCPPPCVETGEGSAVNTQRVLIKELWEEFRTDDIIFVDTITKTVRFRQKGFFELGETQVNELLKAKINAFIPRYFEKLYTIEKKNPAIDIKEIRIEGHTDNAPSKIDPNCVYVCNYEWSTQRAFNVLKYFVNESSYIEKMHQTSPEVWKYFMERLVPSGYAYTKPLDKDGKPTILSNINPEQSRRIEFRVIIEDAKPQK
jgi:outer membrane protein OmpA-like peptidoglycan-associated protein